MDEPRNGSSEYINKTPGEPRPSVMSKRPSHAAAHFMRVGLPVANPNPTLITYTIRTSSIRQLIQRIARFLVNISLCHSTSSFRPGPILRDPMAQFMHVCQRSKNGQKWATIYLVGSSPSPTPSHLLSLPWPKLHSQQGPCVGVVFPQRHSQKNNRQEKIKPTEHRLTAISSNLYCLWYHMQQQHCGTAHMSRA